MLAAPGMARGARTARRAPQSPTARGLSHGDYGATRNVVLAVDKSNVETRSVEAVLREDFGPGRSAVGGMAGVVPSRPRKTHQPITGFEHLSELADRLVPSLAPGDGQLSKRRGSSKAKGPTSRGNRQENRIDHGDSSHPKAQMTSKRTDPDGTEYELCANTVSGACRGQGLGDNEIWIVTSKIEDGRNTANPHRCPRCFQAIHAFCGQGGDEAMEGSGSGNVCGSCANPSAAAGSALVNCAIPRPVALKWSPAQEVSLLDNDLTNEPAKPRETGSLGATTGNSGVARKRPQRQQKKATRKSEALKYGTVTIDAVFTPTNEDEDEFMLEPVETDEPFETYLSKSTIEGDNALHNKELHRVFEEMTEGG